VGDVEVRDSIFERLGSLKRENKTNPMHASDWILLGVGVSCAFLAAWTLGGIVAEIAP
jgi:hypothetical protein